MHSSGFRSSQERLKANGKKMQSIKELALDEQHTSPDQKTRKKKFDTFEAEGMNFGNYPTGTFLPVEPDDPSNEV